ncbi:hypothetical protein Tdes44962_MAKER06189 [Teratosphaeria destructans]|uniref:Uncharacterized protein n=1 Tax=Teratosphaeria destructans TaxID=418781 RepID=A0A9W7SHZ3_9PEZI|nr:hypothetical protein Tdes44962_MAKER06189 [Teratosphaeria destructans]
MFSSSDDPGEFVRDVLTVLAASHYPLQVLSLSIPDLYAQAFEFPPTQSTEITKAFHALRELEIRSKVLEALSDDLWVGQGYSLVDMMKQAIALEGLKLDAKGLLAGPDALPGSTGL